MPKAESFHTTSKPFYQGVYTTHSRRTFKRRGSRWRSKDDPKAISSIWRKMKQQKVEFEEVYDKFAIRIIIDTPPKKEKADCWRVYSLLPITTNPIRNGCETGFQLPSPTAMNHLHTTVVVPGGEWVEVQIRTSPYE